MRRPNQSNGSLLALWIGLLLVGGFAVPFTISVYLQSWTADATSDQALSDEAWAAVKVAGWGVPLLSGLILAWAFRRAWATLTGGSPPRPLDAPSKIAKGAEE